jgi:hypothetical protein
MDYETCNDQYDGDIGNSVMLCVGAMSLAAGKENYKGNSGSC